jgi:hypothetical protein
MLTTVGQVLVNDALPPRFRDYGRVMDSNGIEQVLQQIAREAPEEYAAVTKRLMDIGNSAAFDTGTTIRMSDLRPAYDKRPILQALDIAEEKIRSDKTLTDAQKSEMIEKLYDKANSRIMEETYNAELARKNQLALQVASKARGNKVQLAAFISTPGTYSDPSGKMVPMFIRHSFAEGLTPAEYWAGSFGARNGVVSTKTATAKGGAFGKLLSASAIAQVITEEDCGTDSGLPVKVDDDDNIGAVLAKPAGGYDAGTVITKQVLSDLRKDKRHDEIVVRSPTTCGCKSGICSKCAGIRETGGFPPIGYNLGTNAASAFAERITQGALNCLAEGTLVRMADGSVKPIEKIRPGEIVLGCDLNGHVRPTPVVNWYDNGIQPCVRTEFKENGSQGGGTIYLDSTIIHKILCTRVVTGQKEEILNWHPRILPVGTKSSRFYAYTVSSFDDSGLKDEPLAMLIGALIGDGCYTKSVVGVHLSCADDTEIDDLQKSIIGLNISLNRLKGHNGIYYRVSMAANDSPDRLGNPVKNYLVKHGMYGKFAHEKTIPDVVHSWSNKSIGDFIGGLIASDGSVYSSDSNGKPGVSFSSTSMRLVEQVKELMTLRFGIIGSKITRTGKVGQGLRNHDQYQFTITKPKEVEKFASAVNIPGVKAGRLRDLVRNYRVWKVHERTAFKRVSQVEIGPKHVYDIEIGTPEHIFLLANGLVVSNTKHSGKSLKGKGEYQGFEMITSLAKVPKVFPDRATLSTVDGNVSKIEDAPQGGKYVFVTEQNGEEKRHYVAPGYDIDVKVGDEMEAGDQISDGVIDPSELVKYKGIGEARKYWASRFTKAMRDSGMPANRRNAEVLARTIMNTVKLENEDEAGEGLPGDVLTYTAWSTGYKPRKSSTFAQPTVASIGKYLEQPVLHYTIGTRITPSVIKTMKKFKVDRMMVNDTRPEVEPFMERIEDSNAEKKDWMARLGTTYLKSRLMEDVARGAESHLHSTEPYPGIAKGVEFGDWGQPLSKNKSEHFTY